jgi:hypothetical protein
MKKIAIQKVSPHTKPNSHRYKFGKGNKTQSNLLYEGINVKFNGRPKLFTV